MSDNELLKGFAPTPCDKCGGKVEINDDAVALLVLMTGNPAYGLAFSRHILPVVENGTIVCPGSPSRAQYLEGQSPDSRTEYKYQPENEAAMREAYDRLQQAAAALASN